MASFIGQAAAYIANGNAGDVTPDFTAVSWQPGDFAVAYAFINDDSTAQVTTAPAGWWKEGQFWDVGAGDQNGMALFWKFLQMGEDTTPSFSFTNTDARSVTILIFRGADAAFPFDALVLPPLRTDNNVNPTSPAYTTITAAALGLVWAGITQATITAAGAPSGYTLRAGHTGAGFTNAQQLAATVPVASPGTQTPGAWTNTFSGGGNTEESMNISAALRDAGVIADLPEVEEQVITPFGSNTTSHLVAMPASVPAGRLLILFAGFDGTGTITNPAGWTRLDAGNVGSASRHIVAYKTAAGTEGGTTVDVVTSGNEDGMGYVWMIDNWDGPPEFNETGSADPPSLTASWGAASNLWITGSMRGVAGGDANIAAPHGFQHAVASQRDIAGAPTDMGANVARFATAAATMDPSTWSGPNLTAAWILVVKGAAASQEIPVNPAEERELANPVTPLISREVLVGQAVEVETANPISPEISRRVDVGPATERELANPITPAIGRVVTVDQAVEVETANPITPAKRVAIGTATEVELGRPFTPVKPIFVPVQTATERELGRTILAFKGESFLPELTCNFLALGVSCQTHMLPVESAIITLNVECTT